MLVSLVLILLSSYQKYLVNIERNESNWEAEFVDIRYEDALKIKEDKNIKEISIYYDYGVSIEDNTENTLMYNEKFNVKAYDDNAIKNSNVILTEGRLPENSDEVVVSEGHFQNNKIGDKINITLEEKSKTFTIVGKAKDLEEDQTKIMINFRPMTLLAGVITYLDKNQISNDTLVSVRILTKNVKNERWAND